MPFSVFFRVKKFGGYTNFIYFCTGFQNDEDKSSTKSRGKVNGKGFEVPLHFIQILSISK